MNALIVTILLSAVLVQARPQNDRNLKKSLPSKTKNTDLTSSGLPKIWWNSLTHNLLLKLNGEIRLQQEMTIRFEELEKDNDIPPASLTFGPQKTGAPSSLTVASRSSRASTRPLSGDQGVCGTRIGQTTPRYNGYLYYGNNRFVNLYQPLYIKSIACRQNEPSNSLPGNCVLVAYPHGTWIRVTQAEKKRYNPQNCMLIPESKTSFMCWDYVAVPGYCVLQKQ